MSMEFCQVVILFVFALTVFQGNASPGQLPGMDGMFLLNSKISIFLSLGTVLIYVLINVLIM